MLNRRHKPSRPTVCLCHRLRSGPGQRRKYTECAGSSAPSSKSASQKKTDRENARRRAIYEEAVASEELPAGDSTANSLPAAKWTGCYQPSDEGVACARCDACKLARRTWVYSAAAESGAAGVLPA
jgi:hypothetical protein